MSQNLRPNYVEVSGPESGGIDRWTGDEFPVWCVSLMYGHPVEGWVEEIKHYTGIRSWEKAQRLGEDIARDRKINLVDESTSAR